MSDSKERKSTEVATHSPNDTELASISSPIQTGSSGSKWQDFKDSFKPVDFDEADFEGMTDLEKAIARTAKSPLQKSLKNRHLQMIAIGGSIGTGLFVGSGGALARGGPAALLIGWSLIGSMIFATVHAMGELAVRFPISGAFNVYSTRFLDPSWGFAMGWNYALQWMIVLPLELVAASITIGYWDSDINPVAWVSIFYVFIVAINFFGVKGYGEAEFIFSAIKVIAIIGFIILGIILNVGGGPQGGYIGGTYWQNPGAFSHGFKGLCSVFVTAAFSFAGTELVGLTAAEAENPRKSLPKATKQVFWRITLFYMVALTVVGLLVPYDDERLGTASDASASPFVLAIHNAGISGLDSVMNVVIMIAVLSVGNSAVYACSRTLTSLAGQGFAPAFLLYVDRKGRPLWSTVITLFFGLLSFVSASDKQTDVFNWMLALSGLSSLFTWGSVCAAHIRFRHGMAAQGRDPFKELAFTSQCGIWGSYWGVFLIALILVAQFWVALWPIGESPDASVFFQAYLALPVIISFYTFHKVWKKNWSLFVRASDIDLDSGRAELDYELLHQEIAEEKAYIASRQWWYRTYSFWC